MPERLLAYLATLPYFAAYLALAIALLLVFLQIYAWITPHRELELIRAGNDAAAIALAGALFGFVVPLASTIAHSLNIPDMLLWGMVAMAVQIATFVVVKLVRPEICAKVAQGETASAVLLAAISLGVGILNAACMTT
jgi:putative membrane protein